jgi:hypothetical protein
MKCGHEPGESTSAAQRNKSSQTLSPKGVSQKETQKARFQLPAKEVKGNSRNPHDDQATPQDGNSARREPAEATKAKSREGRKP